jgi:hypothetical protein
MIFEELMSDRFRSEQDVCVPLVTSIVGRDDGEAVASVHPDHRLDRSRVQPEFWRFADPWLKRAQNRIRSPGDDHFERLIFLWVVFNSWITQAVSNEDRSHEDRYLVGVLASDPLLNSEFERARRKDRRFRELTDSFASRWPIFKVRTLQKYVIEAWHLGDDREEYVRRVLHRSDGRPTHADMAPRCFEKHVRGELPRSGTLWHGVPVTWSHTIAAIYMVRCNLFHGGKDYQSPAHREIARLAFLILWQVWRAELQTGCGEPMHAVLTNHGFQAYPHARGTLVEVSEGNLRFLQSVLRYAGDPSVAEIAPGRVVVNGTHIDRYLFARAFNVCQQNAEGGSPDDLSHMEPRIAGLVRVLNRLGCRTVTSCEGHVNGHNRLPYIEFESTDAARKGVALIEEAATAQRQRLGCVPLDRLERAIRLEAAPEQVRRRGSNSDHEDQLAQTWEAIYEVVGTLNDTFGVRAGP